MFGARSGFLFRSSLLIVGLLALSGCSIRGESNDLTDSEWVLSTLGGAAAIADVPVTMHLAEDDGLFGSAGCNRYTGTWDAGSNDSLSLSPSGMTMMACEDAIADQEQAFLDALDATSSFRREDDTLTLRDSAGSEIATMTRMEKADLEGTEWHLRYVNNGNDALQSALDGVTVSATFNSDGTVNGIGGCNTFTTSFETDDESITIQPAASTMMACDQPIMDQEFAFLQALKQAAEYETGMSTLTLRSADGANLALFESAD